MNKIIQHGLVALFFAAIGHASIVYTNVTDVTTGGTIGVNPSTSGSVVIDLGVGGGSGSTAFTLDALPTFDVVVSSSGISGREFGSGNNYQIFMDGVGSGHAMNVSAGVVLQDQGSRWGNSIDFNAITGGSTGYFGIRASNTAMTGSTNPLDFQYLYGWVGFTRQTDGNITIHDLAYETTINSSIIAGAGVSAVPEPASYAALAGAIALGVVTVRRRRKPVPSSKAV